MGKFLRYILYFITFIVVFCLILWVFRLSIINTVAPWLSQQQLFQISAIEMHELQSDRFSASLQLKRNSPDPNGVNHIKIENLTAQFDLQSIWHWWQNISHKSEQKQNVIDESSIIISEKIDTFLLLSNYIIDDIAVSIDALSFANNTTYSTPLRVNAKTQSKHLEIDVKNEEYDLFVKINPQNTIQATLKSLDQQITTIHGIVNNNALQSVINVNCTALSTFLNHQLMLNIPFAKCQLLETQIEANKRQAKWALNISVKSAAIAYEPLLDLTQLNLAFNTTIADKIDLQNWQQQLSPAILLADIDKMLVDNWQVQNITGQFTFVPEIKPQKWQIHIEPDSHLNFTSATQITDKTGDSDNSDLTVSQLTSTFSGSYKLDKKSLDINNVALNIDNISNKKDLQIEQISAQINAQAAVQNANEINMDGHVNISSKNLKWQQNTLSDSNLNSKFGVYITEKKTTIDLLKNSQLRIKKLSQPDLLLRNHITTLQSNSRFTLADTQMQLVNTNISITNDSIETAGIVVTPVNLDITALTLDTTQTQAKLNANYALSASDMVLENEVFELTKHKGQLSIKNDDFKTTGQLELTRLPEALMYELHTNFATQSGHVSVKNNKPLTLKAMQKTIAQQASAYIDELNIDSGTMNFDLHGKWQNNQPIQHILSLDINDLSAQFDEKFIKNSRINSKIPIPFYPQKSQQNYHALSIEELNIGVPINNLEVTFHTVRSTNGALPVLEGLDVKANVFDGVVTLPKSTFDLNVDKNTLLVSLKDIDLTQIIATQQLENVDVTGKLQGQLPLQVGSAGVSMENGKLESMSPGTIRYRLTDEQRQALSNPITDQVITVLEDFHYDKITAQSIYENDGNLIINFQIAGTSPNTYGSRPINLNLNTEQNVLSLLKSLQYTDNFNKAIENRFDSSQ